MNVKKRSVGCCCSLLFAICLQILLLQRYQMLLHQCLSLHQLYYNFFSTFGIWFITIMFRQKTILCCGISLWLMFYTKCYFDSCMIFRDISAISTFAVISSTSTPVMPCIVFLASFNAACAASCQLLSELPTISIIFATCVINTQNQIFYYKVSICLQSQYMIYRC